ncbi:pyridoxal phosphate-dependent aminotransferase [bacterium]|nr:pyridoxal phosphate-dependent aminotransferase [bacterium]
MKFADRQERLGTETAFEVLARAKQLEAKGMDVVHLEIGEPDFDTAPHIVQAAIKALVDGHTHYVPTAGIPEVRECFADYITKTRKIKYTPDEIVITPGAKPIITLSLYAIVNRDDEVLYPDPGYPIYGSVINYIGAKPVPYTLKDDFDFRIDFDELRSLITKKTRLIIINSPHNPTGGILTKEDLKQLAEIAVSNDLWVLADEVYCHILYDGRKHQSISRYNDMKERTIIVDGHSKTYAMTGWRLGFGAMPVELAKHITKLCTNFNSCTAGFVQLAGKVAIESSQDCVRDMVSKFTGRRRLIIAELADIEGITCRVPKGAFYAFPNISEFGLSSLEMQDYLLDKYGLATLAGTSFGKEGEGFIRLSYANSPANINKAMKKLRVGLENLRNKK